MAEVDFLSYDSTHTVTLMLLGPRLVIVNVPVHLTV